MQVSFESVTNLFKSGQYEQGYNKLQLLIETNPENSNLHLNAGLFQSQMQQHQ